MINHSGVFEVLEGPGHLRGGVLPIRHVDRKWPGGHRISRVLACLTGDVGAKRLPAGEHDKLRVK